MAQELNERLSPSDGDAGPMATPEVVDTVLDQMEAMLGKLR